MRIVEALITCIILITGLSASIYLSTVYTAVQSGSVKTVAADILNVLDGGCVIERIVNNQSSWETEIRGILENLLPPDVFYTLTVASAVTGDAVGEITNLPGGDASSNMDSVSIERIVTISLPLSRNVTIPLDVMLIMDTSGSMNDKLPGDTKTKLYGTKQAAKIFIDQLNSSRDRVGLVTFNTNAYLKAHLTSDFASVKSQIEGLSAGGYTNIGDGISYGTQEFDDYGREDGTIWVMILLSDGKANRPDNEEYARTYALGKADEAESKDIRIYTIGLGAKTDIDEDLLKEITANDGKYYYAPSTEDLTDIYTNIAQDLAFMVRYDVIVLQLTLMKPR